MTLVSIPLDDDICSSSDSCRARLRSFSSTRLGSAASWYLKMLALAAARLFGLPRAVSLSPLSGRLIFDVGAAC